jgi:hypothetical protein
MLDAARQLAAVALLLVQVALASSKALADIPGTWSIQSASRGEVRLTLHDDDERLGSHDVSSFSVDPDGLDIRAELASTSDAKIAFTLAREAGSFACSGIAGRGRGGGIFAFTPSTTFFTLMRERGYSELTAQDALRAAGLNLAVSFVDGLAGAGYGHLPFPTLIVFRALGIDATYVRAMQAALGPDSVDAQKLISLRALGIDAAYIKRVQAHGFEHPTIDQLIRLKALQVISALAGLRIA